MPGQPRDSYDMVVRKLAELERELEREKRHRHPTGRNSPSDATVGVFDAVGSATVTPATFNTINLSSVGVATTPFVSDGVGFSIAPGQDWLVTLTGHIQWTTSGYLTEVRFVADIAPPAGSVVLATGADGTRNNSIVSWSGVLNSGNGQILFEAFQDSGSNKLVEISNVGGTAVLIG